MYTLCLKAFLDVKNKSTWLTFLFTKERTLGENVVEL